MKLKTIQVTFDTSILEAVDAMAAEQGITSSEFIHAALARAVREHKIRQMEERQIVGYREHPDDDTNIWEDEQVWPD